jgi:hypothetical protein
MGGLNLASAQYTQSQSGLLPTPGETLVAPDQGPTLFEQVDAAIMTEYGGLTSLFGERPTLDNVAQPLEYSPDPDLVPGTTSAMNSGADLVSTHVGELGPDMQSTDTTAHAQGTPNNTSNWSFADTVKNEVAKAKDIFTSYFSQPRLNTEETDS